MKRGARGPAAAAFIFGALDASGVPGPTLVALLGDLGMAEPAARTMLSRMVRAGQMSVERRGRTGVYRLAGAMREQFLRFRQALGGPVWEGGFWTVIYEIDEAHRALRDSLRERAEAAGFGIIRPGLLIGLTDPSEWCRPWLEADDVLVEIATLRCEEPVARRLAERAWRLTSTRSALREFLELVDRIQRRAAEHRISDVDAFRVSHEVMSTYALLHLRLPALPLEITPDDWPGRQIPDAMRRVAFQLYPGVRRHADAAAQRSGHGELVVPLDEPGPNAAARGSRGAG